MLPFETFERLVIEALDSLPPFFQEKMSNVEVLVEDEPSAELLAEMEMDQAGDTLLGLYQGIPLTERYNYNLVMPDTITLYQKPIEAVAGKDYGRIREEVRHTVIHEIAHHFGIDDDRLIELGAY
jgi:predicted Zn-dependent protease with MMP-like domain